MNEYFDFKKLDTDSGVFIFTAVGDAMVDTGSPVSVSEKHGDIPVEVGLVNANTIEKIGGVSIPYLRKVLPKNRCGASIQLLLGTNWLMNYNVFISQSDFWVTTAPMESSGAIRLPLEHRMGLPILPFYIEGRGMVNAALDTGAFPFYLNPSYAPKTMETASYVHDFWDGEEFDTKVFDMSVSFGIRNLPVPQLTLPVAIMPDRLAATLAAINVQAILGTRPLFQFFDAIGLAYLDKELILIPAQYTEAEIWASLNVSI